MKTQNSKRLVYLEFFILMLALGASDALRGVFAPIFKTHFSLNKEDISVIITVSYIGNLLFLLVGSYLVDCMKRKRVFRGALIMWMASLLFYILTDNYYCLLIAMFVAMGSSTLLSTMINLVSPLLFLSPGLVVNTLFFVQGIGTSSSQSLVGNFATNYTAWKFVNGILLCFGLVAFMLLFLIDIPDCKKEVGRSEEKSSFSVLKEKKVWYFIFPFGFYFIAEHGIMNWFMIYSQDYLKMDGSKASFYLAAFFGGITVGRLVMAPLVVKLGTLQSIRIFGGIGTALYVLALLFGSGAIFLLGIAGLFFSIIYPTLVLSIQSFYKEGIISTVTGFIISIATLFDILFNSIFGKCIDRYGFKICFKVLPLSMLCFYLMYNLFVMKYKPQRKV